MAMEDNLEILTTNFEEEYAKIIKDYVPSIPSYDYKSYGVDFVFKKFSLYNEIPNSIASTDSLSTLCL